MIRSQPGPIADDEQRRMLPERGSSAALLALIGMGVLIELLCIYAVAQPLSLFRYPFAIAYSEPIAALLGRDLAGLRSFLGITSLAVLLYLLAGLISLHCRGRQARYIVLGFSLLFALTLLIAYPAGARDVFTNIVDGRMRWIYGFNPMVSAPRVIDRDPLFAAMTYWQDEPSYYGPLWYLLLILPARIAGTDLVANIIAFRALTIPFLVGSAYLASRIAGGRRPELSAAAALLVGWSPLLLWESAVNGHNDIVMVFFAVFALERAGRRQWQSALPLLALSILVKWVTVILVPLFFIVALRDGFGGVRRPLVAGVTLAVALGAAVLAPFWDGAVTFAALLQNGSNRFISSPATLLAALIDGNRANAYFTSAAAGKEVKLVTLLLFLVAYTIIAVRLLRDDDLLTASFYSLFFFLVLVSWWFWPWYVSWLAVLGGALVKRRPSMLALIFSFSALYVYMVLGWRDLLLSFETNLAFPAAAVMVGFLPPVIFWASGLPRPDWLPVLLGETRAAAEAPGARPVIARPRRLTYNRRQGPARATEVTETRTAQRSGDAGATAYPGGGGAD